ncbi:Hypothetical protein ETEE_0284 [Edwardsiella anguillarum ET080813]|uniref:Uncharacterized protein n=1 Tax=Edwardsiella anguillarum ET080813 TaxID=667120 RepID=A0A076LM53_9GAMM|nr:Hypothetical protein ETEE_0284 [Edwardsiella anguillarum ET080813]
MIFFDRDKNYYGTIKTYIRKIDVIVLYMKILFFHCQYKNKLFFRSVFSGDSHSIRYQ